MAGFKEVKPLLEQIWADLGVTPKEEFTQETFDTIMRQNDELTQICKKAEAEGILEYVLISAFGKLSFQQRDELLVELREGFQLDLPTNTNL